MTALETPLLSALHKLDFGASLNGWWTDFTSEECAGLRTVVRQVTDEPIPLVIHCPKCGVQHVDRDDETGAWATTRHHRKHLCKPSDGGCGHIWAPSDRVTVGVLELELESGDAQ